jgi:hypothetical protein
MSERFVMLTVTRGGKTFVADGGYKFKEGDRTSVAIHLPERKDALRELAQKGWTPVPPEASPAEDGSEDEAVQTGDSVAPSAEAANA